MKKLLAFLALIIVVVLLLNVAISRFASQSLEQNMRTLLDDTDDDAVVVTFDETSLNTLTASFQIQGLNIFDREENRNVNLSNLSVNLSYGDFFTILFPRSREALLNLKGGQIRINDFALTGETIPYEVRAGLFRLNLDGNLFDFVQALNAGVFPDRDQFVEVEVQNLSTSLNLTDDLSVSPPFPDIKRLSVNTYYRADSRTLTISSGTFETDLLLSGFTGSIFPEELLSHATHETRQTLKTTYQAQLEISAGLQQDRIDIGEDGAGIHFEGFQLGFSGSFDPENFSTQNLLGEGVAINMAMNDITIYPTSSFQNRYGRNLRFLGVSTEKIVVPGMEASYSVSGDVLAIDSWIIDTPLAEIMLEGALLIERENFGESQWQQGYLSIRPNAQESRQFIETVVNLLGFRVERSDGRLRVPIGGSLSSPVLVGVTG